MAVGSESEDSLPKLNNYVFHICLFFSVVSLAFKAYICLFKLRFNNFFEKNAKMLFLESSLSIFLCIVCIFAFVTEQTEKRDLDSHCSLDFIKQNTVFCVLFPL